MKNLKTLFLIVSLILMTFSCKEDKVVKKDTTTVSTFYFIRHAEKDRSNLEDTNPELNQDGLGRAVRWAEVFDPIALDEIYTTDYQRTSMTAAPTSVKKDIEVKYYSPEDVNIKQFIQDHKGKNVLVVGHANSTPSFVNKIIGEEKYEAMGDYDNSSFFIVRFIGDNPTDIRLKMD